MQKEYSIYFAKEKIGTASVCRQGLYYKIRCRCDMTGTVPCRVIVTAGEQETDLGLCVPTGGCFGLETSIPIKRIGEGMLSFRAQTRHRELPGTFLSVHPDEPFRYIARLKDAYLARRDGRTGIVIREAEAGSPVPQGSGQIP